MESCKRTRKTNFSPAECSLILQLTEENLERIREKFSSTLTNKKKQAFRQSISDRVNPLGVAGKKALLEKQGEESHCRCRKPLRRE